MIPPPPLPPPARRHEVRLASHAYSTDDLDLVNDEFKYWSAQARTQGVETRKITDKLVKSMLSAPPLHYEGTDKIREVTLVQQITVRGMYCSQIIRKITKKHIQRMAHTFRNTEMYGDRIKWIDKAENFALKLLPSKIFTLPQTQLNGGISPHVMLKRCAHILAITEEMKEVIEKKKIYEKDTAEDPLGHTLELLAAYGNASAVDIAGHEGIEHLRDAFTSINRMTGSL
jgi:hypothetical protein